MDGTADPGEDPHDAPDLNPLWPFSILRPKGVAIGIQSSSIANNDRTRGSSPAEPS